MNTALIERLEAEAWRLSVESERKAELGEYGISAVLARLAKEKRLAALDAEFAEPMANRRRRRG